MSINISCLRTVFSPPEDQLSHYTGQIISLAITCATPAGIQLLSLLPQRLFAELETLSVSSNQPSAYSALAKLIGNGLYSQMKTFSILFYTENCASCISELTEAVSKSCSLNKLGIHGCSFNSVNILPLCVYISSPKCMLKLGFSGNSFEANSLLLISSLPCTKSLESLNVSAIKLSLPDTEMLSARSILRWCPTQKIFRRLYL